MKYIILISIAWAVLCSCTNKTVSDANTVNEKTSSDVKLPAVVNETDPICNMDMKEHLSDTAMIDGQIWGFCSIVCKEKYLQSGK